MSEAVETEYNIKTEADENDIDDPDGMDGMDDADEQNDSITVKVEPDFVHLSTDEDDTTQDNTACAPNIEITPRNDTQGSNRDPSNQGQPDIPQVLSSFSAAYHKPTARLLAKERKAEAEQNARPLPNITLDVLKVENPLIYDYLNIASGLEFSPRLRYLLSKSDDEIFLSVSNKEPDTYLQYRTNLTLIVRSSGKDLLCTLYNFNHQVFKNIVIRDFENCKSTVTTRTGIFLFLKELQRNRYSVCCGAFAEDDIRFPYSDDFIRMVLIEKFEGSIVYRHRDCYMMVPRRRLSHHPGVGTSSCESCLKLKSELIVRKEQQKTITKLPLRSVPELERNEPNMNISDEVEIDIEIPNSTSPRVHKTRTTYKKLIFSAISSSPHKKLSLQEIKDWILDRFPQFQDKQSFGNSIRHNLSLCHLFTRMERQGEGKGNFWTIDTKKKLEIKVLEESPLPYFDNPIRPRPVLTKVVSIAPKPLQITSVISASSPKASSPVTSEVQGINPINKNIVVSDALKALPSSYKEQLKKGLPVILRPISAGGISTGITPPSIKIIKQGSIAQSSTILTSSTNTSSISISGPIIAGVQGSKPVSKTLEQSFINSRVETKLVLHPNGKGNVRVIIPRSMPDISTFSQQKLLASSRPSDNAGLIVSPPTTEVKTITLDSSQDSDDIRVVPGPGSNPQKDSDLEDSTISIIHVNTNNAGKDLSGVKKDFPMPPFSMIELIMISIFYSRERQIGIQQISEYIRLFFPYYRKPGFSREELSKKIKEILTAENRIFYMVIKPGTTLLYSFDGTVQEWKDLIVSDKWFKTPVDADLFHHMSTKCPEFMKKLQSIRTTLVPVKYTLNADNAAKKPLLADKIAAAANATNRGSADFLDSSLVDSHKRNNDVLNDVTELIDDQDHSDIDEEAEIIEGDLEEDEESENPSKEDESEAVMNEELTSRNDLYNILKTAHQMKAINSMVNTEAIKLLTDQHGYDERVVNNFIQVFKKRFLKVNRNTRKFEKNNEDWLEKVLGGEPPSKKQKLSEPPETQNTSENIVDIKEEAFDLDLDNLLTAPSDAFDDIDTDIVEEDPLAS